MKDPHVAMALRLEAVFGLRREEAIKFMPARDDRGACIRLTGSTTKGGRPREVPVRNDAQRTLLDEARRLVGGGALIPPERNYRQQLKVYESQTRGAGPVPHAWPSPSLCAHVLRGDHRLEGAGGGRPAAAFAHGREAADRHRGSQGDRPGTRA